MDTYQTERNTISLKSVRSTVQTALNVQKAAKSWTKNVKSKREQQPPAPPKPPPLTIHGKLVMHLRRSQQRHDDGSVDQYAGSGSAEHAGAGSMDQHAHDRDKPHEAAMQAQCAPPQAVAVSSAVVSALHSKAYALHMAYVMGKMDQQKPAVVPARTAMIAWCRQRAASLGAAELAAREAQEAEDALQWEPSLKLAHEVARLHFATRPVRWYAQSEARSAAANAADPATSSDATSTSSPPVIETDVYTGRKAALGAVLRSAKLRAIADVVLNAHGPIHIAGLGPCIAMGEAGSTDGGGGPTRADQEWVEPEALMPATLLALAHGRPLEPTAPPQLPEPHTPILTSPSKATSQAGTAVPAPDGSGAATPTLRPTLTPQAWPSPACVLSHTTTPVPVRPIQRLRTRKRGDAAPAHRSSSISSSSSYSDDFEQAGEGASDQEQAGGIQGGTHKVEALNEQGASDEAGYSEDFEREPMASSSASSVSTVPIAPHHWDGGSSASASLVGTEDSEEVAVVGAGPASTRHEHSGVGRVGAVSGVVSLSGGVARVSISGGGVGARVSQSGAGGGAAGTGGSAGAVGSASASAGRVLAAQRSKLLRAEDEAFSPEVVRARVGAMATAANAEVKERWARLRPDAAHVARLLAESAALRAAVDASLGQPMGCAGQSLSEAGTMAKDSEDVGV